MSGNDNFADAISIPTLPYTSAEVNNVTFTVESGETLAHASMTRTAWWTYTPGVDGTLVADTFATTIAATFTSDPDTILGVWSGTSLAGLTLVGVSDDGVGAPGAGFTSLLSFPVTAGVNYWFQVAQYGSLGFEGSGDHLGYVLHVEGDTDGEGDTGPPPAPTEFIDPTIRRAFLPL